MVGFNKEGDSFGKYDIFQYQQISKGVYKYVHIGDWIDRFGYYQHEILYVQIYSHVSFYC